MPQSITVDVTGIFKRRAASGLLRLLLTFSVLNFAKF